MAGKKEYATRFGLGLIAVMFLVTSVAFTILVVWQAKEESKKKETNAAVEQAVQDIKETNKGEDKLEGTILKDFTTIAKVDTLQKTDLVEGTGVEVKAGDTITAHYTGALASTGVIFQSSLDTGTPFTSPLSGLIAGWQEGIPGMKAGGTRRLIIPAAQAYGPQAQNGIPANSDLVFDIQLISVGN